MNAVYYLPGHGGRLATGLGEGLASRGWSIAGRETLGEFREIGFREQVRLVAEDLQQHFWHEQAKVVAVSFGAYLFLHAQTTLPPFPGSVLLLSPIVGEFSDEGRSVNFSPPHATRLSDLAKAGRFTAPPHCHIHVGSDDWQSRPEQVLELGRLTGIGVTVVPGAGHMLGKEYVGPLLDEWLAS